MFITRERDTASRALCRVGRAVPTREEVEMRTSADASGTTDRGHVAPHSSSTLPDFARLNLIGDSAVFQQTLGRLARLAACDAATLIEGETGTGKELAARAIHYLGARRDFPFTPVNCGALPDHLVENELFGHARGAYTDARETHDGLVAEAEGGTLFLDEVETLSPRAQIVLLRFLQDGTFRRLGGRGVERANV